MNKILWISAALLSLIISIIINFSSTSLVGFIVGSLIAGLIIFAAFALIIQTIKNIKKKNIIMATTFGIAAILVISIFSYAYFKFSSQNLYSPAITPAHFRTNIFTGKCDFGGASPHRTRDPWYYRPGCEIPKKEKIQIFKEKYEPYDDVLNFCNELCENRSQRFCSKSLPSVKGISCKDITACELISCD